MYTQTNKSPPLPTPATPRPAARGSSSCLVAYLAVGWRNSPHCCLNPLVPQEPQTRLGATPGAPKRAVQCPGSSSERSSSRQLLCHGEKKKSSTTSMTPVCQLAAPLVGRPPRHVFATPLAALPVFSVPLADPPPRFFHPLGSAPGVFFNTPAPLCAPCPAVRAPSSSNRLV
jgi:hypothetical protein